MTASTLRRVQDVSADIGWRGLLRIAPQWLVCRRYLALAADLEGLTLDRPSRPELRVTGLEPADVTALCALEPGMTREEVARRLASGQRCTLGWWGRELAHVRWDSAAPVHLPFLGRVLEPGPDDEIVVSIYTAPAFRGHGIAGAVMVDTARHARDAGVRRWVWLAAWWNRRSLALADQFASRVEGTVGYWKLGRWRRYFASGRVRLEPDGTIRFDDGASSARRRGGLAVLDWRRKAAEEDP
jgi:GNAT superfamily N-acetyltransferase